MAALATRVTARPSSVLDEIVARRRVDIRAALADLAPAERRARLRRAPDPRPFALSLAAPGLHLIAEVKRSSPSAGVIAASGDDIVARARRYEAGAAAAISVLCEPHWFGGSIEDLALIRSQVSVPVLAKDFVVEARQLELIRAAGADAVLLLAAIHRGATLGRLVDRARDLGLEPLVEAHDERELDAALATNGRVVGINNRDLRSLEVNLERAAELRSLIPEDRLAVAESGVRDTTTVAGWRALGYDAALVGETLVRASDPTAAAAAFVRAGRPPDDLVNPDHRPMVKICGVRDLEGVFAAVRADADAIGLNLVPGTPRQIDLATAAELAAAIRTTRIPGRRPAIVAITVDLDEPGLDEVARRLEPDAIQLSGHESVETHASAPRPTWKVLHVAPGEHTEATIAEVVRAARPHLDAGASRILLDTAGGAHPGGTGVRLDPQVVATIAAAVPVTLAGGLDPRTVGDAVRGAALTGVDVASGVERSRSGDRPPTKDPLRVALFVKRARHARDDRPHLAARPRIAAAGLLDADARGRWGTDRSFGGRYVPETLMAAVLELERAYAELRHDPRFWAELRERLETFAGRPTPLVRAHRLGAAILARAGDGAPRSLRLYLKREDLAHTGAHKINNALGQALLTRRLRKTRVIAETGAGQHGVATATACALLGLPCVVYMGAEDIERQQPNVLRMRSLGAEVRSVTSGSATLKDAINEAMRDWVTNVETTHYVLGSAMGPHPYPTIVRDLQRRIGDEAAVQLTRVEGRLPDLAIACVGGGSNAIGLLDRFIGEPGVRLAVAEAAGDGIATGRHAAALAGGTPGILHGARSLMLQDRDGQVLEAHSASAGLDYPGIGPQIAALATAGRLEVLAATDHEAFAAMALTAETEGILPALETAHAIAALPGVLAGRGDEAGPAVPRLPDDAVVLLGFSGRGDKDLGAFGRWREAQA
jgi:tryptophan synthase beta subunit